MNKKRRYLTLLTNKSKLMTISASIRVTQPYDRLDDIGFDGKVTEPRMGLGGINLSLKLKDNIFKFVGDHMEPYASTKGTVIENDDDYNTLILTDYTCIGNEVIISDLESPDRWAKGWVVGKHAGVEHIMVYFNDKILERMEPYIQMIVKCWGQGLKLLDFPEIRIMNIDPRLFEKIGLKIKKGKIQIPVVGIIPAELMGSGLGSVDSYGDYDIMNSDMTEIRKLNLDTLKLGDLVAIRNHYSAYGFGFYRGAWTIGIIIHGACSQSGHGAGVCVIMTAKERKIEPIIVRKSNIEDYHVW